MKTFVFGIGGTGARVLRSLTLLLASGVECKSTIVPIIIDPDLNNGDLTRTVSLMQRYTSVRNALNFTNNGKNRFFSTEIFEECNFRLPINNSQDVSFQEFMDIDNMTTESKAMLKMLYSDKNLGSNMIVGFKGNPNIGSVVLNQFADTEEFKNLANDFTDGDRIFIISSIFGGTGASGFPLLLKTLRTNDSIPNHGLINKAEIGAVTVLPYFKITQDDNSSIESDSFIAKTKAALAYYEKNIGRDINTLYYIGDNTATQKSYANNEGGENQKNNAHLIEMLSALAVINFTNSQSNAGGPVYKEFGLASDEVENIIFSDFASGTIGLIRKPMTQMMLFTHYLKKMSVNNFLSQQWSRDYKLDRNFFASDFINNLLYIQNDFETWLKEMKDNQVGFTPFTWDKENLFDIVNGLTPHKPLFSFFKKDNYELFDITLDKKHVSNNSETKEQKFTELFYQSTETLVHDKLNM
jgi:hypothetical protein